MNALNNWIRGCLPQKATLVRAGQSCAVLRAVAARSIPFLKRNIPAIGLGLLLTGVGVGLIRGALFRKNRDALEMPLNRWAGADAGRQAAARRMLDCYDSQSLLLDLVNLRLTELPPGIELITNLTTLDLSGNQLTALPESIGRLTNLTSLGLHGNQLTALPESIGRLTKLATLYLMDNQLTALPESIGRLTKLTTLGLKGNQLTALPESIGRLTNLTTLGLGGNQLTALPESIGRLTNLTTLDLGGNQLTALPESIGRLTKLATLYLSGNHLTALPESIGRLTKLTYLDLSGNQLTALPESIGDLTNRSVYLDRALIEQMALTPVGIVYTFLRGYPDLSQDEREFIIRQGMRAIFERPTTTREASQIFNAVAAVPPGEREDVMDHAEHLINGQMNGNDIAQIIAQVAAVNRDARDAYIADRINGMAGGALAAAEGINVHAGDRDDQTKVAMELLRNLQGTITTEDINRHVGGFKEYLEASGHLKQAAATRALLEARTGGESFGPLLDNERFSIIGLSLTGEEVIARMWLYASTHPKVEDQDQAKSGMIGALGDSFEGGDRVCNQGKTQRLCLEVLQGRLAGVNIDGIKPPSSADAVTMFFLNPNHQSIEGLEALVQAANQFANDNPNIEREGFLQEITAYAVLGGIG